MSFGFGVSDFLAVGQLALAVYNQCQRCSGQYRELSSDAGQLALTLSNLEDLIKKGRLDSAKRSELLDHGQACKQVLLDIQEVLEKYESLSSKSKRIHDILGWDYEDARELRNRLTASVVMLSAFYNTLTTSSIFRLEDAMNRMLRQIQRGQTSADSISVLTTSTVESIARPQAWRQVIQDLEDLGISADDASKHRAFIVQWFARAFEAAKVTDSHAIPSYPQGVETMLPDQQTSHQKDLVQKVVSPSQHIQEVHKLDRESESSLPKTSPKDVHLLPIFNVSLNDLFSRDKTACPIVVYQCVQAVDLFGLNVEHIYSNSGSTKRVEELGRMFQKDLYKVDLRNPAWFHEDIVTVATLLKRFLRCLPDPLFTTDLYSTLINLAKTDDNLVRRDSLHAAINTLPDSHYATLRMVALHLAKVARHSHVNKMSTTNLGICFGPTLLGGGPAASFGDSGRPALVVETMLNNVSEIFLEDDDDDMVFAQEAG